MSCNWTAPKQGNLEGSFASKKLQGYCGSIVDVLFSGKGFYHIEFDSVDAVETMVKINSVDVRGGLVFFTHWHQGFSLDETFQSREMLFPISTVFLGLRKEYMPFLKHIAS